VAKPLELANSSVEQNGAIDPSGANDCGLPAPLASRASPQPPRRQVVLVDVTQAASQASRPLHEACDLNLPVEPGVRDGETHSSAGSFLSAG
jgi:hypothetical protein